MFHIHVLGSMVLIICSLFNIGSWLDATEWHIYFFSHEKNLEICVKDTVG